MSVFMENGLYFPEEDTERGVENEIPGLDYLEDASRSVELVREEGRDGQLGSFGFTLIQEKPPRVGTVIPGGPADKAGLRKGEIVLTVAGKDVTHLSHREVTFLIRSNTDTAIWLSVCETEDIPPPGLQPLSFMSSAIPPHKSIYSSTPALSSQADDRVHYGLHHKALANSTLISSLGGRGLEYGSPRNGPSPLVHKKTIMTQGDPAYVEFVPPPSSGYVVTRMWCMLLYCGPVKIPASWSQRGVSSLCIQECARQLLGKRMAEEFVKVHLEVSQSWMKITNTSGNVFTKHKREGLYYCGLCSNDEQHFGIVTLDTETYTRAEMCHVFKLLPDSKLSKYCIDKSKSLREVRSGQPTPLKTCTEITETIQTIFQNEVIPAITHKKSIDGLSDSLEYGVVRGVNMFQLAPGSSDSLGSPIMHSSPMLKRKKSNVVDLRVSKKDQKVLPLPSHGKQRSVSIPINHFEQRSLAHTNSAGHIHDPVHIRMGSDGSVASSSRSPSSLPRNRTLPTMLLNSNPSNDKAKRISDSSLSSVSSDGHRSHSGSSSPKHGSGSPTPRETRPSKSLPRKRSHQPQAAFSSSAKSGLTGRGRSREGGESGSGLKRQGSASSIPDLPGLSPYHLSLPKKNSLLSSSVDSIVTITTLAEDDIETIVGQVASWCGSFDKLLEDPLGVKCFEQFLEGEHSEENIHFWKDVQDFKVTLESNVKDASRHIFDEYLASLAPQAINIDDRVLKAIEPTLESPTRHMYNEAQKEIYRLMKMDSYPRFKKSELVKECLTAEIEGRPLPISLEDQSSTLDRKGVAGTNGVVGGTLGKKKNPSLLSRIKNLPHRSTAPTLSQPGGASSTEHPLTRSSETKRSKKERRDSKKLRTKSLEGSSSHPEENLKQLQVHKKNLFELSLPNRVTKIIEARPNTTIRDAIVNVLKKYNYSLEVMEVKLTNTLQPVDISAQAAVLIGKHVSVIRSKHTITVKFPDHADVVLPANSSYTLRDLFDNMMVEKGKMDSYSVYLEGARAPIELNMSAGNLEGHIVHIKYNPSNTFPSNTASTPPKKTAFTTGSEGGPGTGTGAASSGKLSDGVDELFSMIARLSADTLQDQSMVDDQQSRKLSPRDTNKKGKWLGPRVSPKFSRTKSGTSIPETHGSKPHSIPPRSISPPVPVMQSLPIPRYPPAPKSDPPNATLYGDAYGYAPLPRHGHQRSLDAMSGVSMGSGSSVDSITHELAADRRAFAHNHLREWVNSSTPQYFPAALGSQDTLERSGGGQVPALPNSRGSSLTRGHTPLTKSLSARPLNQSATSAFQRQVGGGTWTTGATNGPQWRPTRGPGSTVSSDGHQFSDSESMASSGCHSNASAKRMPLSPTTHVLVVEDQQHSETFV